METIDLTVGIFGDPDMIKSLGKKGNINDIALYSMEHTYPGGAKIISFVSPKSEKIVPILQAAQMSDICVIVIDDMTKELGEMIIAIDAVGIRKGFILLKSEDLKPVVDSIIKGTSCENFVFLPRDTELLKQRLLETEPEAKDDKSDVSVTIDNSFVVKSVGTVVLGCVRKGTLKEYDKLVLEPLHKDVTVKSIQSQDRNIKVAGPGKRVGLFIKGADTDDLKRGYMIAKKDSVITGNSLVLEFSKSRYYKGNIKEGMRFIINTGLQSVQAVIRSIEKKDENRCTITLETEKPVSYYPDDRFIIAGDNTMPRIAGFGTL